MISFFCQCFFLEISKVKISSRLINIFILTFYNLNAIINPRIASFEKGEVKMKNFLATNMEMMGMCMCRMCMFLHGNHSSELSE